MIMNENQNNPTIDVWVWLRMLLSIDIVDQYCRSLLSTAIVDILLCRPASFFDSSSLRLHFHSSRASLSFRVFVLGVAVDADDDQCTRRIILARPFHLQCVASGDASRRVYGQQPMHQREERRRPLDATVTTNECVEVERGNPTRSIIVYASSRADDHHIGPVHFVSLYKRILLLRLPVAARFEYLRQRMPRISRLEERVRPRQYRQQYHAGAPLVDRCALRRRAEQHLGGAIAATTGASNNRGRRRSERGITCYFLFFMNRYARDRYTELCARQFQ